MEKKGGMSCFHPFTPPCFIPRLLEQLRGEFCEIDAPVFPDVATLALIVFIFVAIVIQLLAIVHVVLIQEIGLSNTYPIEFRLFAELRLQLAVQILIDR